MPGQLQKLFQWDLSTILPYSLKPDQSGMFRSQPMDHLERVIELSLLAICAEGVGTNAIFQGLWPDILGMSEFVKSNPFDSGGGQLVD